MRTCRSDGYVHFLSFFVVFAVVVVGCAAWLAGSQFPKQGLNPGHGSESPESEPLGHRGAPSVHFLDSDDGIMGVYVMSQLNKFYPLNMCSLL